MTINPMSSEAIRYAWQELLRLAGVAPGSDSPSLHYGTVTISAGKPVVAIIPSPVERWSALVDPGVEVGSAEVADLVPSGSKPPFGGSLPILFPTGEAPPYFSIDSATRTLEVRMDLLATVFFMLSRWEETVVPERDEYQRFPATVSLALRQGFLDVPVLDRLGIVLAEWLRVLSPGWEPQRPEFQVELSHDIDHVGRFPNARTALRTLGADMVKRRSPKECLRTTRDFLKEWRQPEGSPTLLRVRWLAARSLESGLRSVFNFMAAEPSLYDPGYDVSAGHVRSLIHELQGQGFEIGFHPGYLTFEDPDRLASERSRLDRVVGEPVMGGRQHFLRFRAPDTWRRWDELGLRWDSTLGYADHEGFRCGTCRPFQVFDLGSDRPLSLEERPLVVMDGTLHSYRGLTPEQAYQRIIQLAGRCREVGGTFTLLWHNTSLDGDWVEWLPVYERVLRDLSS